MARIIVLGGGIVGLSMGAFAALLLGRVDLGIQRIARTGHLDVDVARCVQQQCLTATAPADQHGRAARCDAAPVVGAPHSGLELGDRRVQRGVEVLRARLGPRDGSAAPTSDLDTLAVLQLAAVALMKQLHLQPDDLVVVALQPLDLLGDVHPEMLGDLDVPAGHDNLHSDSSLSHGAGIGG